MRIARWALPALLAALPLSAAAQEEKPFRIGIGGSVDVANINLVGSERVTFLPVGFSNVSVPMWFGALRIEPEFGYLATSAEETFSFEGDRESFELDTSAFRLGGGIAWSVPVEERTRIYFGPKLGVIFRSSEEKESVRFGEEEDSQTTKVTSTDFWIGAAVGGEAFLTPNFSLGIEAQLNYVDLGEPEVEFDPEPEGQQPDIEVDASLLSTHALFTARIYFL
ncbi:outer membrane beta-barrel protein [Vulgatibacter sp.]|uniref:outer membrane beta-barrel protein n=1 Tax=Vulgatibacter sp. TaxID=1971226 RepID=UPI003565BA8A